MPKKIPQKFNKNVKTIKKKNSKNVTCFTVCSEVLIFGLLDGAIISEKSPIKFHNIS